MTITETINSNRNSTANTSIETCRKQLKQIIVKNELYFTKRCNESIELAIKLSEAKLNPTKDKYLLIQEEGGWITYRNYAKKYKMHLIKLKMNKGKIELTNLRHSIKSAQGNAIIILHSLPGYSYTEDMKSVKNVIDTENLKNNYKTILINDVSGSIGTESAVFGDLILCSFGRNKPLSAGKEGACGGFIASDNFYEFQSEMTEILSNAEENAINNIINFKKLESAINNLKDKIIQWNKLSEEIKDDLLKQGFEVLNKENKAINILVRFADNEEKERLINYCKEHRIEYTVCPRYIRTNEQALSLEIKNIQ